jgi:hypothetical protein
MKPNSSCLVITRGLTIVLPLTLLIACGSGNSSLQPDPEGAACWSGAAGWQHECIGDIEFRTGGPEIWTIFYQENGYTWNFEEACCEGDAVKSTADAACQSGCYRDACAGLFNWLDEQGYVPTDAINAGLSCRGGGYFEACNNDEPPSCGDFAVMCDVVSNELFDTEGAVPLEHLETKEWCGAAAENAGGESDETGEYQMPVGSVYHVSLDPTDTAILADWTSRTWGNDFLSGNGDGYADYRIETCPTGGGNCIHLLRLVIYGGDIEVNNIEVSNLIAQLINPVWLPYGSTSEVDIYAGDLPMLVTYKIDNTRIAWEASNSNVSGGMINPTADEFILDTLEFSGSQGDIEVFIELDVGGSHQ